MILLLIFAVGLAAGFVDAIAGGGGLIMLPGLLFAGLPVGSAIATKKGTKFIRPIFILVTTALVTKLALSYINS